MRKFSNWRLDFLLVINVIVGGGIIAHLFFIQVLNHKLYKAQALGQEIEVINIEGQRGQIFCSDSQETKGKIISNKDVKSLATNKEVWSVFADTSKINDKLIFAQTLSQNIGISEEEILRSLLKEGKVLIKKDLFSQKLEKIKKLNLEGIYWQKSYKRFYPHKKMLSQVLGFIGGEGRGQYGIEGYYDEILAGKKVIQQKERGLLSLFFLKEEEDIEGKDIYLTVDYNIQLQSELLLEKAKEKLEIESGQIVVIKPDSGRILAMANFPTFDPNLYFEEKDYSIFQNSVIQRLFEPGSILKPITMAAALNEGKITPETVFKDTGSVKVGIETIHNFNKKNYGLSTMTRVLEESINTGAVFVQQQLGNKKFLEYLEKFGFFEKTGIDLQGEIFSRNENLKKGPDVHYATASFGQGIEVTPLQIVRAFCVFANGGRLVKPFIVDKIVKNGQEIKKTVPEISQPIISPETVSQLNSMLVSVVENGFGGVARIPGYWIAGKTGTAQVPLKNGRGYEENKTIQSFIGYAPAFNPQFLILVKLDNPKVAVSALSAVPIFRELAQFIFNYWKIPPDYEVPK